MESEDRPWTEWWLRGDRGDLRAARMESEDRPWTEWWLRGELCPAWPRDLRPAWPRHLRDLHAARMRVCAVATKREIPARIGAGSISSAGRDEAPSVAYPCPISLDPIKDPVCTASGSVYDREPLLQWFATKSPPTDPATNEPLSSAEWWAVPKGLFETHARAGTVTCALRRILLATVVARGAPSP